jgi:hypothetical protein
VPQKYSLDPQLARWVRNQRLIFNNGKMNFERKEKLNGISFELSVKNKANEENWNLRFKKLQEYHGKHGHCELSWAVIRFDVILNTHTPHLHSTFLSPSP